MFFRIRSPIIPFSCPQTYYTCEDGQSYINIWLHRTDMDVQAVILHVLVTEWRCRFMIVVTKLHIPRERAAVIARPRLMRRLHAGLHYELTSIAAPPGYGKTTILSQWAAQADVPVAWVSLDPGDNDRSRFWALVVSSLKMSCPALDDKSVHRFSSGDATGASFLAALINGLHRLAEPAALVWDDFHVIDEPAIIEDVSYLLQHLPSHIHIYIASRTQPVFSTSRMLSRGTLNRLEAADLRFDARETSAFFDSYRELQLSKEETDAVWQRTEGWAAGMRLAALLLSLDRKTDVGRITGRQRDYADYFFEEIMSKQSEEMQRFLLYTSILKRMNAPLCEAVTASPGSSRLLEYLDRSNLFLVSLDDQRQWYRYHHLFGQFLHDQLLTRVPQEKVKALHAAAGRWLESNGYGHEAMAHYLAGMLYDEAIRLLEQLAPGLMRTGMGTLRAWFAEIPDPLLFSKPMLFMMKMASLFLSGQTEQASATLHWAKMKLAEADMLPEQTRVKIHAGLLVLEAFHSYFAKDFDASLQYSEQYVRMHPQGDLFVGLGTDEDGYQPMWDIYAAIDSLHEAERVLREYIRIWSGTNNVFFVAHLHLSYARLLYERNLLYEAEQSLRKAMELGEQHDHLNLKVVSALWIARIYTVSDRAEEALAWLGPIVGQVDRERHPLLSERIRWSMVWLERLRAASGAEASSWLSSCGLRPEDEIPLSMMDGYDLYACLLAEQGKWDESLKLFDRLLRMAERTGRRHDKLRFLLHQSLAYAAQESFLDSMDVLEQALELSQQDGYLRTYMDEGDRMVSLLAKYVHARQHRLYRGQSNVSLAYAKRLLQMIKPADRTDVDEVSDVHALTPQERNIVQLMHQGLSNKEIAARLGIALSTLKTHIHHIYRKLQANNRWQAVQRAKLQGLDEQAHR